MKYTRIYSDDLGESHFENVEASFQSVNFAPPAPPLDVTTFQPASKYGFLKAPSGWFGDWHPAPCRQIIFYLEGETEAEASDGEVRLFGPGSVVLVEDITGKGHRSKAVGSADVLAAVVQLDD